VTDATKRASSDQSIKGLKSKLGDDRAGALSLADTIVKNTYRTLMTRGLKGCYVYCTDAPLAAYIRSRLRGKSSTTAAEVVGADTPAAARTPSNVVPFRHVSKEERDAGLVSAPVIDLRSAVGAFSGSKALDVGAEDWVELPDWVHAQPGLFVAQVVGESMNRRISNGSWCLFRAAPTGVREGKVVVVQHHSIKDPETGEPYTVKLYSREKVPSKDGGWRHDRITLRPDSDQPQFAPIEINVADGDEGPSVVAEMLAVLSPPGR
jgi:hypothetical protein